MKTNSHFHINAHLLIPPAMESMRSHVRAGTKFAARLGVCLLALLPAIPAARAENVSVKPLHQFAPLSLDGAGGQSDMIVGSDGAFYGTTTSGGFQGTGTIFRLTSTNRLSVLHNFGNVDNIGANADGAAPNGSLLLGSDGFFYGTTYRGGNNGNGVVFKFSRTTGAFTVLHHFGGKDANGFNADGAKPTSTLIQGHDGAFYGTALQGGSGGSGTIFKITAGGIFSDLHDFNVLDASKHNADGAAPRAGLLLGKDGFFYGTTTAGGVNGNGVVFKYSPGGPVNPLHSFGALDNKSHNADGATPYAALIQGADEAFYGTAISGGTGGNGTVFRVTANGTLTTLHSFSAQGNQGVNADGAAPYAGLLQTQGGYFYGTAASGGTHGTGAIYRFESDGTGFAAVYSLEEPSDDGSNYEGGSPYAGLVQGGDGLLYGVAFARGYRLNGTIFQYDAFASKLTVVHQFEPGVNRGGATSYSPLLRASDGSFYGSALYGGPNGTGTIFKLAADGTFTLLHNFSPADSDYVNGDGYAPGGTIAQGTDGNFYGVTEAGGIFGPGTAYRMTPAGKLTVLHNFGYGAESGGASPFSGLVRGNDGNFYGTCTAGGAYDNGTVYRLTPAGVVTSLHDFTPSVFDNTTQRSINTDGLSPKAELLLGKDGSFYGVAHEGGSHGNGTVFKITPAGAFTVMHQFDAETKDGTNTDGTAPSSALIQGADGNFYGVASFGGSHSSGTVFVVTPDKDFAVLHSFSAPDANDINADGAYPSGSLLQGSDGYFYGVTDRGGLNAQGTVFRVASLGGFDSLHSFTPDEGARPQAALIQDDKGTFYGTTAYGGSGDSGSVFTMVLSPAITSDTTASATVGQPFSYQITATNGPTQYGVQGLPAWLKVDTKTGLLSGTPTATGTKTLTLKVLNRAGNDTKTLTLTIKGARPDITSPATASGKIGTAFTYQITATNDPTKYGVSGLRQGLSVNKATGLISGKPAGAPGTYTMTLQAANGVGTGTATLTLTIK